MFDENRRSTYLQSHPSANGRESSVLSTFDGGRKQLLPVCILLFFDSLVYMFVGM